MSSDAPRPPDDGIVKSADPGDEPLPGTGVTALGHAAIEARAGDELGQVALATLLLERGVVRANRDGLYHGGRTDLVYGSFGRGPIERAIRQRYLVAYAAAEADDHTMELPRGMDHVFNYLVDGSGFADLATLCDVDGDGRRLLDALLAATPNFREVPTVAAQAVARFAIDFAARGRTDLVEVVLAAHPDEVWPALRSAVDLLTDHSGAHLEHDVRLAAFHAIVADLDMGLEGGPGFPINTILGIGLEPDTRDRLLETIWAERRYARSRFVERNGLDTIRDNVAEALVALASPALRARLYQGAVPTRRKQVEFHLDAPTVAALLAGGYDVAADGDGGCSRGAPRRDQGPRAGAARARRRARSAEPAPHCRRPPGAPGCARRDRDRGCPRSLCPRLGSRRRGRRAELAWVLESWPAAEVATFVPSGGRLVDVGVSDLTGCDGLPDDVREKSLDNAIEHLWADAACELFARNADDAARSIGAFDCLAAIAVERLTTAEGLSDRFGPRFLAWLPIGRAFLRIEAAALEDRDGNEPAGSGADEGTKP